jgi:hypothetical protein
MTNAGFATSAKPREAHANFEGAMRKTELEQTIEDKVTKRALKELGVISIKLNLHGNNGWPDRMFLIPGGKPLFIEFKRPDEEPRSLQSYIHKVLAVLGYQIEVHDDVICALQSIARALEAARLHEESYQVSARAGGSRSFPRSRFGENLDYFGRDKAFVKEEADLKSFSNRPSASLSPRLAKGD